MDDETQAAIDLAVEGDEQLLREALEALNHSFPRLCEGCYLKWPFNAVPSGPVINTHLHPRGGMVACSAQVARAAITKLEQRLLEE